MAIQKDAKTPVTALSIHDRKILDKYTKYYSNFIESNTAKTDMVSDDAYRGKQ